MSGNRLTISGLGSVQKSSSSKATAFLAREAYWYDVSTATWRERRWRLFSTDPFLIDVIMRAYVYASSMTESQAKRDD